MADDAGRWNELLAETSFLYGANSAYVEGLYARWASDPDSVDPSWRGFFATLADRVEAVRQSNAEPSWSPSGSPPNLEPPARESSATTTAEPQVASAEIRSR